MYLDGCIHVSVTETLISMFPKEGSTSLEVPKPSSAAGIISTFATGELTWALSGALSSLFMVADVIATQEVNKIMNDVREYNYDLLQRAKLGGLSKLRLFLDMTYTDKLIGYDLFEDISQETHNKIMRGEINTNSKLIESINEESGKNSEIYYTYLIQRFKNHNTNEFTYVVDSVFTQ